MFTAGVDDHLERLFSALQADVAGLLGMDPARMVASQTVGGNVGDALAPVVILIGATAIDAVDGERDVFRQALGPAAVLLGVVAAMNGLWGRSGDGSADRTVTCQVSTRAWSGPPVLDQLNRFLYAVEDVVGRV